MLRYTVEVFICKFNIPIYFISFPFFCESKMSAFENSSSSEVAAATQKKNPADFLKQAVG